MQDGAALLMVIIGVAIMLKTNRKQYFWLGGFLFTLGCLVRCTLP